ncbi:helix-turn-helix domain-containing protein [Rosistilla oblonga]|uniref:helix-turn-helix domain-containing protein n=1 Tax=Rosistilla oblonga TaxID=2527990 RepID=UPI003A9691AD
MATPKDKYFGNLLRSRREVLGLSQTAFAKMLGIDRTQLAKYEKGTHVPSVDYAAGIAEAGGFELFGSETTKAISA